MAISAEPLVALHEDEELLVVDKPAGLLVHPTQLDAHAVAIDGRVFFLNTTGLCTVVSARQQFDRLTENQLDDETIASPAVSDGRLFIRGRKTLYCIGSGPQ